MARRTALVWVPADTADALQARYRAEAVIEVRTRLHALWRLRRGESPTAAVVGVSPRSVQRWRRWYREGGLAAVCGRRSGGVGKPSYLTKDQERQVAAAAAQDVFGTAAAVRDWIEDRFGVRYTRGSVYTLLARLGLRLKTPRPRHAKADPRAPRCLPLPPGVTARQHTEAFRQLVVQLYVCCVGNRAVAVAAGGQHVEGQQAGQGIDPAAGIPDHRPADERCGGGVELWDHGGHEGCTAS